MGRPTKRFSNDSRPCPDSALPTGGRSPVAFVRTARPGPVLGMGLLFVLMLTVPRLGDFMRPTGEGILRHLSLLFVPAGVGVVGHLRQLGENGLALGVALVASTVLAIGAGVLTFVLVARLTGAKGGEDA